MSLATLKSSVRDPSSLALDFPQRLAALEAAVQAFETWLAGGAGATLADMAMPGLPTPVVVITNVGAGSTSYTYTVADVSNIGMATATPVQTTTGNATLSATAYNVITWTAIPGHVYNVYRTAGGTSQGLIGSVTGTGTANTSATFSDTGIAATANTTPPSGNTTGMVACANLLANYSTTALNNASGQTLTVAQILGGLLIRSGAVTVSDATPTAAAIVAAVPGAKVGQGFELLIRNGNSGTLTLTAGTNVTLAAGNTNTVATVNARLILFVFTNVTPGSEAVTMYTGPLSAY